MQLRSTPHRNRRPLHAARRFGLVAALAFAIGLGASLPALAERADRDKPVNLEADRVDLDDAKKEAVFIGSVTLTQGTLTIKADKIIVKQDAEGFQYGIAYGNPAHFRQKREGFDEYVEGYSERVEYDGRADKVQMFTNARIERGGDEVRGDYIAYNAVTETYQVIGGSKSASTSGTSGGKVHVVIKPKQKPGAPTAAPGSLELKPSTSAQTPK